MAKPKQPGKQKEETPMMRQYEKVKSQYPGVLLLFRVGDFYEAFYDDAKQISESLNIVLTRRSNGAAAEVPMAGFPHHAVENYVAKLVKKGFRVAVCDQVEDPKFARGVVRREITDIVTPGVNFSDRILDEKRNNYLCAVHFAKADRHLEVAGVAFIDVTTAEFQIAEVPVHHLKGLLQSVQPAEIILSRSHRSWRDQLRQMIGPEMVFTELDEWMFSLDYAEQTLLGHFKTHSLKGFGIENFFAGKVAASVILNYLQETQRGKLQYIKKITPFDTADHMSLDPQTKRNLEIIFSMQDGSRDGTLIEVIDKTITAMGARLFKKWVTRPSRKLEVISERLDSVEELVTTRPLRHELRERLRTICDLERVLSRIATARANPKEVLSLGQTLKAIPHLKEMLKDAQSQKIVRLREALRPCPELTDEIDKAIDPEAPATLNDGGVIRQGYHPELNELRTIATSAKDMLLKIQQEEREKTGISSLKVQYNRVFGYYIEVSRANSAKVPDYFEKKQTLVNAERYTVPVLKDYEQKILTAEERMVTLEQELFSALRQKIAEESELIQANAQAIASLDCLASLAECAEQYNYVKPDVSEEDLIEIVNGRHPVLEQILPAGEKYVPNNSLLDEETRVMIITGPNMSGKSSYLRQTGLIVLLAQIGSFVPAEQAKIGIVDKIFTRVGASDNLAAGESTFLVEMNEAANILNNGTAKSLILLDEIGRGTSTYDGMSIAWAMTEFLHDVIRAKVLFATHYHELAELETHLERVRNFNATVEETADKVIFLRKIEPGAADNSYGIEVAKMAGLPEEVIARAKEILADLEGQEVEHSKKSGKKVSRRERPASGENYQISMFEIGDSKLKKALQDIDINKISPIEALLKLSELKRMAEI
ncbi:MAG: DNA mismatch repair protein MutS [Chlorobiales bacterium]|nr:DNA mismatch repair protein MutS [Chlorobiales bacterium]